MKTATPTKPTIDLAPYLSTPWLVEQTHLPRVVAKIAAFPTCYSSREVAEARRAARREAELAPQRALQGTGISEAAELQLAAPSKPIRAVNGKVGVIGIYGPLQQRMSSELMKAGGTSMEEIGISFDMLQRDTSVEAIILDIDSPGGTSYGTEELADKIFGARGKAKPTYAVVNSLMASAACWIGSSADMTLASPGSDSGGIGVYCLHVDESMFLESQGFKVTAISAGKYKTELAPFVALSEEAKAYLQESVNTTHDRFLSAMKRNRSVGIDKVRSDFGQGRLLNAEQAVAAGLADRVLSFDDLLSKLTGERGQQAAASTRATSIEVLRLRHAQDKRKRAQGIVPVKFSGPGLTHDSKTQDSEPEWGTVDKTKLPDNAFADRAERGYPHHWVQDGGEPDDDGRYTTGSLWLHQGGLNAAWAAAQGARSGQKASEEVIAHLAAHRKALGMED